MATAYRIRCESRADADVVREHLEPHGAICTDPVHLPGTFGCVFYIKQPYRKAEEVLRAVEGVEVLHDTP